MNVRLILFTSLLLPALAQAEPPRSSAEPAVEYGFDDDLIQGDLHGTKLEILQVRRAGQRASLVEVRTSYLRELLKSVEDL